MEKATLDAFILYNEREPEIEKIVHELEHYHVTTYFWRGCFSTA